jgi:signal transduction histidine kinase
VETGVEVSREVEALQRRLLRLGLDLHDGPLQDIAALGTDLHLFRSQLTGLLDGHPDAHRALGRIDDLVARLGALDAELREVGIAAEAGSVLHGSLSATLADVAGTYSDRFETELGLDDDLDDVELTDSQRIALVRVVQSALANVARHSGARRANVTVRSDENGVHAEVADDGSGFDVERALVTNRVGLAGMRERVRLLGGRFEVASEPGRGTTVRLHLPRYST